MESAADIIAEMGKRIRTLRKERGWSIEELARRAERHPTFISGIERGERNVTIETVFLVVQALGTSIEDVLGAMHPLTRKWKCSSKDVLDAVASGFRAQVDVMGKLAELKLFQLAVALKEAGLITSVRWMDKDNERDFEIGFKKQVYLLECKNVRSGDAVFKDGSWKVELQKTRNSLAGRKSRGYPIDEFDVLGVCLFNQAREWRFLFASALSLERRDDDPTLLKVFQRVPQHEDGIIWFGSLDEALKRASGGGG